MCQNINYKVIIGYEDSDGHCYCEKHGNVRYDIIYNNKDVCEHCCICNKLIEGYDDSVESQQYWDD